MLPTDLTVGALVEQDGAYLIIEEEVSGRRVLTQPGGHLEADETPEAAAERETYEESGCLVNAGELLGVYLWIHPQTRQQFLRIMYVAELQTRDSEAELDDGIVAVHWYDEDALRRQRPRLRTPTVLRAIEDYQRGRRPGDALLSGMLPLQHNVTAVLASASLV